jgi:predicted Zn-dependent protease
LDRSSALRTVRTAAGELDRAMREMRIPGHPRPYYISYLIRDEERFTLQAKFGSLIADTHDRGRNAFIDVRVGSYRADQVRDGGLADNDKDGESYSYVELPFGSGQDGLRYGLWRLTDSRYREAVESLLAKRSHELTYLDPNRRLPAFERRKGRVELAWRAFPEVDRRHWADYVQRASRVLKSMPDIKDAYVEFRADHACRSFISSEGSRRIQCQAIWSLECYLWLLSERGDAFPWTLIHTVADPSELPDQGRFRREIRAAVTKLRKLSKAKTIRSFCGPALLEPVPAGLLLHEAVGHRLEGNRLLAQDEGQTFKDCVGQPILPPFLSIHDDPRLERFEGRSLVGHYRFDDEGVEAQKAKLVDRGVLTGYLTSRVGISRPHRSNGHARGRYHERPISRMGVLVAEPANGLSDRELKERLIEEIRRQGAPFGVRVMEATSGETATDAYNFQAFLGEVNLAAKVFPDGREEWIRGVNFVGTPLNAIRSIIASGKRLEVDNAYCGAESGHVPVSTISPALLVSELELQSKPDAPYTQYSFPIPWQR